MNKLLAFSFLTLMGTQALASVFNQMADKTYRKYPHTLTLHVTMPPEDLEWNKNPRHLLWSLIKNKYFLKDRTRRTMGHVTVELNCEIKGKKVQRFGGQGAKNLNQFSKLLIDGAGFNVVLSPDHQRQHAYLKNLPLYNIDGFLENQKELTQEYENYLNQPGLFNLVSFKLDEPTCEKLVQYYDQYEKFTVETQNASVKKGANVYGNGVDPLKYEGAGCAPFALAFMKLAGVEQKLPELYQTIYVNKELFSSAKEKVSLLGLIFSSEPLSQPGPERLELKFPDPAKMYQSINQLFEQDQIVEKGNFGSQHSRYIVIEGI
jgi:hypothetical protein